MKNYYSLLIETKDKDIKNNNNKDNLLNEQSHRTDLLKKGF